MRTRLMVQMVKEAVALVQMEKVVVGALLVGEGVPTNYVSGFHRDVGHLEAVEGHDERVTRVKRHVSVGQAVKYERADLWVNVPFRVSDGGLTKKTLPVRGVARRGRDGKGSPLRIRRSVLPHTPYVTVLPFPSRAE